MSPQRRVVIGALARSEVEALATWVVQTVREWRAIGVEGDEARELDKIERFAKKLLDQMVAWGEAGDDYASARLIEELVAGMEANGPYYLGADDRAVLLELATRLRLRAVAPARKLRSVPDRRALSPQEVERLEALPPEERARILDGALVRIGRMVGSLPGWRDEVGSPLFSPSDINALRLVLATAQRAAALEAENERLRKALAPFVAAYEK